MTYRGNRRCSKWSAGAGKFSNEASAFKDGYNKAPQWLDLSEYDENVSPQATLFYGEDCTKKSLVAGLSTSDDSKTYNLNTTDLTFNYISSMRVPAGLSVQTSD